jgi:hypothetical protein
MLKNKNITLFFIVGHGRSGTMLISKLLNNSGENVIVRHEDHDEDLPYFHLGMTNDYNNIITNHLYKRFNQIFDKLPDGVTYGEVNSLLRYNIDWLKENLNPFLIHLVRDGRDVVRSMYSRKVYLHPYKNIPAYPKDNDLFSTKWQLISRFEKLCWYWNHSNFYIKERLNDFIRFEDILADYDIFSRKILAPLKIEISKDKWENMIRKSVNTSATLKTKYFIKRMIPFHSTEVLEKIPHWKNWDVDMTDKFWSICGKIMNEFGYYR